MVIAASAFSIVSVILSSRAMTRFTPARLVPIAFASSAVLFLLIWTQLSRFPRVCAVLVYLLIVGLGSLLTSGFWSIINERFDPRTAKRYIGRIAGAGTLGGILGGALAERIAAIYSLPVMLPVLAAYHLSCGLLLRGISNPAESKSSFEDSTLEMSPRRSGWRILQQAPYLRTLAMLVLLGTMSAGMIDYVFKAQAVSFYGGGDPVAGELPER